MTGLARRANSERNDCWDFYDEGVCIGTIAMAAGPCFGRPLWTWKCCTGEQFADYGFGRTFDEARIVLEAAWSRARATRFSEIEVDAIANINE